MQLTDQVLARNTMDRHVVLSSDAKGTDFIEWFAAGDPSGNDLQIVPPEIARGAAFQRLVNRGIVVLTDENSPEVAQSFDAQRASWEARSTQGSQVALATIHRDQANDTVAVPCIGPDTRNQGTCGQPVPVKEKTKDDRPPLCPQHAHLAPQFVPEQRQEGTETVTAWVRASIGARETA